MVEYVIIIIGVVLFINFIHMLFMSNMNAGIWALGLFSGLLTVYGFLFDSLKSTIWLHAVVVFGVTVFLVSATSLAVYGSKSRESFKESAAIVLGSGIRGEHVSPNLAKRLDKAIEYSNKNPKAFIIVSGGQGRDEKMTEARAMENYLISKGMPKERIIKEEKSTTTEENFLFSLEIAREKGLDTDNMLYITSAFHVYRAGLLLKRMGIKMEYMGSGVMWYTIPMSYMREVMAIVRTYIALWGIKEL